MNLFWSFAFNFEERFLQTRDDGFEKALSGGGDADKGLLCRFMLSNSFIVSGWQALRVYGR